MEDRAPLAWRLKFRLHKVRALWPVRRMLNAVNAGGGLPWAPLANVEEFSQACRRAVRALEDRGHVFGDYLEFGVSRGTTLAAMANVLRTVGRSEVRIFGFDSFQGLPEGAETEGWLPGQFASTLAATRRYLAKHGVSADDATLVEGWFEDTLTEQMRTRLGLKKASLVMVDCDIHSASRMALEFIAPLIDDAAVIFFDDWGAADVLGAPGQKEAFAAFLAERPDLIVLEWHVDYWDRLVHG
ncbi:MAG: TylF/MycF/NovP-related O-methyltransferase, partial [Pseudomonadota bacterium]